MTEDLAAVADASYFDWARMWPKAIAGGEARDIGDVLVSRTGAPQQWWNIAFVTKPLADPERSLREASACFDEHRQPFIVRIRQGVDAASERAAEALGMRYTDSIPGLVVSPIPDGATAGLDLEIRTVADAQALEDCVRVNAEAFGMPLEDVRYLLPMTMIKHPRWHSYVGYVDGQPATTSALLITDGIAGVYFVATPEAFRKRGFGEAITSHAVREGAAAGCRVATLQASQMGRPVYERMGFRLVAQYKTFVRPELTS
jgi:ribosomal protein S18 acetylase RimI-like enzyme